MPSAKTSAFLRKKPYVLDVTISRLPFDPRYLAMHRHGDEYEWVFCKDGSAVQLVDRWSSPVRTGDFIMIPPGTPHVLYSQAHGGCKLEVLMIPDDYFSPDTAADREARELQEFLVNHCEQKGYLFDLPDEHAKRCGKIVHSLLEIQNRNAFGNALRTRTKISALLELAFHLPDSPRFRPPEPQGNEDKKIEELLFFLDSQFAGRVTIQDAVRLTGLGRSSFHIRFRKTTGMTFCQYLNRLRLAAAERMIRAGETPRNAARQCGFFSISNYYQQKRNFHGDEDGTQ